MAEVGRFELPFLLLHFGFPAGLTLTPPLVKIIGTYQYVPMPYNGHFVLVCRTISLKRIVFISIDDKLVFGYANLVYIKPILYPLNHAKPVLPVGYFPPEPVI